MWLLLLSSLGALCVAENMCTNRGENKGEDCDKCDTVNHYFRDPINDGCFYRLSMDYQFNFDLSKPADKHYSAINFEIVPTKPNLDVDFFISSSTPIVIIFFYFFLLSSYGDFTAFEERIWK